MTGSEHFRRAEQLAEEAYRHLGLGVEEEAAANAWSALAQVHATLALAAVSDNTTGTRRQGRGGANSSRMARHPDDLS